ncbi:T9SS type B sorting domain-containing protein [Flavobacterium azooxidireducens]|uniref:T9SS type B sorting domain-containing protein n=1 Tax=Flavobacterium azooxidireducens TaxID=1871076 RepID=A0ABY4KK08_9FLAO|nr:T9SS type B sorting domain-containing protein [Flavobacterium azooxidireducens]UPQ79988.1 T9SS type B sorting domain-containing protein [Flavobacterium azooxidireducens]
MKSIYNFFVLLWLLIIQDAFAQGGAPSCQEFQANFESYQSCATSIPFQNSTGANSESFSTTCIGAAFRGPTWFFIQIQTPGSITLQISQVNDAGIGTDVDFVLWGPFTDLSNVCSQLNISREVDCSWSDSSIEIVSIPNGQTGELYVLLIDNYSNQSGQISISQIDGTGSSDCSFLSSVEIIDDSGNEITQTEYCKPQTKSITARIDVTDFDGNPGDLRFNYTWYRNDVVLSTITDSTISTNTLANIAESGIYRVETTTYDSTDPTVDLTNLPVSEAEIELKFFVLPNISIQNSATVCLTSNPVLQGTILNQNLFDQLIDNPIYQWYRNDVPVSGISNNSFTPTLPGKYNLGIKNGGCNEVISNSIFIYDTPQVSILDNASICDNDSFTITSTIANSGNLNNLTYQWYQNNNPIAGANGNTLVVSTAIQANNSTAAYYLEVTEEGICVGNSNTVSVQINPVPVLNTSPIIVEQCDYIAPNNDGIATTNLTEAYNQITNNVSGLTLFYFLDSGLTQPILTPEAFVNSTANQTIYVIAVNENATPNCTSTTVATIALTVNPTSLSSYPNMAPVCPVLNQNYGLVNFSTQENIIRTNFFGGNPVEITFYLTDTDASVKTNQLTNLSQIPVGIQTIYARIETNTICEGVGVFQVEIITPPLQNTVASIALCENESIVLNSFDAEALLNQNPTVQTTYFRTFLLAENNSGALNKNIPQAFPVGENDIFVRLFDTATQCFSIINFTIEVFPNPVIFNPNPISICGDMVSTFDLTLRNNQITGGNSDYQVFYYETPADLTADNFIPQPDAYQSATKTIFVKVVDPTNNNCFSTTTLSLAVVTIPGSLNNPTPIENCDDSGFYAFDLTERIAEIAGPSNLNNIVIRYYENFTDAQSNNNFFIQNPTNFTNTIKDFQTIYVRVTSTTNFDSETGLACFRVLELDLYVRPFPENNLRTFPYYICVDENGNILREAFIRTLLNETDYTFAWFTEFDALSGNEISGESSSTFSTDIEGNFSVLVTNISNAALCSSVFNFTTIKTLTPNAVTVSPQNLIRFENENTITATATPTSADYEYSIIPDLWQESPIFTNIPAGDFVLKVRNKFGCDEISTSFTVLDFPIFFTPNGDGFNDSWKVIGSPIIEINHVYIFDRYGKLLKEIGQNGNGWDGTFNGRPMPSDDYWFKAIYTKDGVKQEFRSNFSLKR